MGRKAKNGLGLIQDQLQVPTGLPAKTCINPGYHTPISLVIVAFTAFGVFMALLAALLITIRRRHLVSNISRYECIQATM